MKQTELCPSTDEDPGSFIRGINTKLVRGSGLLSPTLGHTTEHCFVLRLQGPQAFDDLTLTLP